MFFPIHKILQLGLKLLDIGGAKNFLLKGKIGLSGHPMAATRFVGGVLSGCLLFGCDAGCSVQFGIVIFLGSESAMLPDNHSNIV